MIGEFNLAYEPHKVRILTDACKTADLIKRLDSSSSWADSTSQDPRTLSSCRSRRLRDGS